MSYHGDIRLGDTIDIKFCTVTTTGAPTQLAGTPAVSAYPANSTTQLTAGITLTVDFDAVTGLNNVRVVATSGNGYATATNYALVITTGTVGGTSVVGYVVGTFSIEARSALMPTTAARTLDVSATGEGDANVVQWLGTAAATPTVAGVPEVDLTHIAGSAVSTSSAQLGVNVVNAAGTAWGSGAITAASIAADAITAAKIADNAIDAGAIAADAITAAKIADGAIDAATFAAGAINAAAIAADAITDAKVAADVTIASVTGAVGSVTAGVTVTTNNDKTGYAIGVGGIGATAFAAGAIDAAALAADAGAEIRDAVWAKAMAELAAVPGVTGSVLEALEWVFLLSRNKVTQTATTQLLRNDADSATIGTSTHSDDGTTHVRGEFA